MKAKVAPASSSEVRKDINALGEEFERFIENFSKLLPKEKKALLVQDNRLGRFLLSIAPDNRKAGRSPYPYLLKNKEGLSIITAMREFITKNYSVAASVNNTKVFLSVLPHQWFDDGVLFTQGVQPFEGGFTLYQKGKVLFGFAKRDIRPDAILTVDDFYFLELKEAKKQVKIVNTDIISAEDAIRTLEALLAKSEAKESKYQEFIKGNPWIFGGQHVGIDRHNKLDDLNIPDFTALRVRDGSRDIIEVKPPTIALFNKNLRFTKAFDEAWTQAERYLDFALSNKNYLLDQKGWRFENPICYLIAGCNITAEQRAKLDMKQRMNTRIIILSYNDLLQLGKNTVKNMKNIIPVAPSNKQVGS